MMPDEVFADTRIPKGPRFPVNVETEDAEAQNFNPTMVFDSLVAAS